jgi:hypothetical protein
MYPSIDGNAVMILLMSVVIEVLTMTFLCLTIEIPNILITRGVVVLVIVCNQCLATLTL